MEQSPSWGATWPSASQEISRTLWNPKVQYFIHKFLPPVPILRQNIPVHDLPFQLLKIHFNIIVLSKPRSCKWFRSFGSPPPKPCMLFSCLPYVPHILLWRPSCAQRDVPRLASTLLASQQLSVRYIASLRAASSHCSEEFLQGHTYWCSCSAHTHTRTLARALGPFLTDVG